MAGSVLIIAPFRGNPHHIGNMRIDRFERWFTDLGMDITIVRAGTSDRVESHGSVRWVTIRDPLNLQGDTSMDGAFAHVNRKPSALRRWISYALLVPDPHIVWAKRCIHHPLATEYVQNADIILASSPTESAFITAMHWSKHTHIPFWMDMRDGWLDEPMKPLLRKYAWQRWREKRLEHACLRAAALVTVTSEIWASLLTDRYSDLGKKVFVLKNGYRNDYTSYTSAVIRTGHVPITLVYAGRISSSRPERHLEALLDPIYDYLKGSGKNGPPVCITFIGTYTMDEFNSIGAFRELFASVNCELTIREGVAQQDVLAVMAEAHGLLLLSPSRGSIPAKFFDYACTGRPILAVTTEGSALHLEGKHIAHYHELTLGSDSLHMKTLARFFEDCAIATPFKVPETYTDDRLKQQFKALLGTL